MARVYTYVTQQDFWWSR